MLSTYGVISWHVDAIALLSSIHSLHDGVGIAGRVDAEPKK